MMSIGLLNEALRGGERCVRLNALDNSTVKHLPENRYTFVITSSARMLTYGV
ncbi:hypothetical protein LQ318_16760 [Aliifodinibius salicampi]|uniref:Uncharacterized protein n=1 Tax=Fodinibius salicampi TaxID=1920655 RepID=A0ABT3Q377_9BACT|nr:hypothetical protein [Fodinibius salicampi]MCW9714559.1 hypothetical protein [Fodinibius salicampi]